MGERRVWVVESGDYEQRGIVLIALSLEAAVTAIKDEYGPPYVVEWEPVTRDYPDHEWFTLFGQFSAVAGYSTAHTGEFSITPYDVAGAVTGEAAP